MPLTFQIAPPAAGTTSRLAAQIAARSRALPGRIRVVTASSLQAQAWRRALAAAGGALDVDTITFGQIYRETLAAADRPIALLPEAARYRLMQTACATRPLAHFEAIKSTPGFLDLAAGLVAELKAARIEPEAFARAVQEEGGEPRLADLAVIYSAYQDNLKALGWADNAGLAWLAVAALGALPRPLGWSLVAVDGFDSFTSAQLGWMQAAVPHVGELWVSLTQVVDDPRAGRVIERAEAVLGRAQRIQAQAPPATLGARLHQHWIAATPSRPEPQVELLEAPARRAEVREALRWLKRAWIAADGARPRLALLARNLDPYRDEVRAVAREFGLPVRVIGGEPLAQNPCIAALLNVLGLAATNPATGGRAFEPRRVLDAWRSPYCDWAAVCGEPLDTAAAVALERLAASQNVIHGEQQWREALAAPPAASSADEDGGALPGPADSAIGLAPLFAAFARRIETPAAARARAHVAWVEALIGPDPEARSADEDGPPHLAIVARARDSAEHAERDISALRALKDVLRGMLIADEVAGDGTPVSYAGFLVDLIGALDVTAYEPGGREPAAVIVASVSEARGVPFDAVALLGMGEGEFPALVREDILLRDDDRRRLSARLGIELEPSTASEEEAFFASALSRPAQRLLLTRARIADNGAQWLASPYWDRLLRRIQDGPARVLTLSSSALPVAADVASEPELRQRLAVSAAAGPLRAWAAAHRPDALPRIERARAAFAARYGRARDPGTPSALDGDLAGWHTLVETRHGPDALWSASALETYAQCGFRFFVERTLKLAAPLQAMEGIDARILGTLYHSILQRTFEAAMAEGRAGDEGRVLELMAPIAERELDDAPATLGFRATAWWRHERDEIMAGLRANAGALCAASVDWTPIALEQYFDIPLAPGLRVHGYIDRLDRNQSGRLRVLDYKLGGSSITQSALEEGRKVQLGLYAMAAEALTGAEVETGEYWRLTKADRLLETSGALAKSAAAEAALRITTGVRAGHFDPAPPQGGCPDYCTAAAFCWHYRPSRH